MRARHGDKLWIPAFDDHISWPAATRSGRDLACDGPRVDVVRGAQVARRDSRSSAFAVWVATLLEQVCLVKGRSGMAGFSILTVRAFDQEYPDNRLYPQLSDDEEQILEAESSDGSNVTSFSGSYAFVHDMPRHIRNKLAETIGPLLGFVSDSRVAVSSEKLIRDSTWVGVEPGGVVAVGAAAVSAASARSRIQGKIMVGHLRYEWIAKIWASSGKHLSLEYVSNDVPRAMEIQVIGGISVIMAQDIARRVAVFRLKENPELPGGQRAVLEGLQEAEPLRPTARKWDYYELPGAQMVRTAAPRQ
jgi:hypothetical protein